MILHNENPKLDRYKRITPEAVSELSEEGYFDCGFSPACVAILPFVKPHHVGLEIGVCRGVSSTVFLDRCAFMWFIDPCIPYEGNPDTDWFCPEEPFLTLLAPYNGRFAFIKGFAADVSDQIPEVDFAFIDGNHEYEYVLKDIKLYWLKIRAGGFLCGHDYSGGHPGVTQAVNEFFATLDLPVETHQYCWLVRKPCA